LPRLAPLLLAALALPAHADLYRWVDPETGSIKFSNSPPAWTSERAREREPEVQLIPSRPAAPGATPPAAVLEKPAAAPGKPAAAPAAAAELERRDPVGAARRADEADLLERARKALQK
jgi:hypothetical protein